MGFIVTPHSAIEQVDDKLHNIFIRKLFCVGRTSYDRICTMMLFHLSYAFQVIVYMIEV